MRCSWLEYVFWKKGRAPVRFTGTLVSRDVNTNMVTIRPDPGQKHLERPGEDRIVDPYFVGLVTFLEEEGKI